MLGPRRCLLRHASPALGRRSSLSELTSSSSKEERRAMQRAEIGISPRFVGRGARSTAIVRIQRLQRPGEVVDSRWSGTESLANIGRGTRRRRLPLPPVTGKKKTPRPALSTLI
ncbi:hypothetical protein MRX96_032896 [Rhipicephalus microplus]